MPVTVLDPPVPPSVRRHTLNRLWLGACLTFAFVLVAATIALLWPNGVPTSATYDIGSIHEIRTDLRQLGRPLYVEEHDLFVLSYPGDLRDDPHTEFAHDGILMLSAIDGRGNRVAYCETSEWFEDPVDGSKYNQIGEAQPGTPAFGGLLRHTFTVEENRVLVDTGHRAPGPPKRRDMQRQRPAGPHCMWPAENGIAPG